MIRARTAVFTIMLAVYIMLAYTFSMRAYTRRMYSDQQMAELCARANNGDVEAQDQLGAAYWYGLGGKLDEVEALKWLSKAAEHGKPYAQCFMGEAYLEGKGGLAKDTPKAVAWLQKAAEQGMNNAQYLLGKVYFEGQDDFPKHPSKAIEWFRKAAEQFHPYAMQYLALAYTLGSGVPKDFVQAYMWNDIEELHVKNEDSTKTRTTLEKVMTQDQIESAQQMAHEWIEHHPKYKY